jgi:hypothetical protein
MNEILSQITFFWSLLIKASKSQVKFEGYQFQNDQVATDDILSCVS